MPGFVGDPQVRVTWTDNSIVLRSVLPFPLSRHIQSSHKGIRAVKQLASVTQPIRSRAGFQAWPTPEQGSPLSPPTAMPVANLGLCLKLRKIEHLPTV